MTSTKLTSSPHYTDTTVFLLFKRAMLRYVVSRTIQRFLSTYLDDLDVESISLKIPGFDADWSGGLDLKNVQLKAGAEIHAFERNATPASNGKPRLNMIEKVRVLIGEGGEIGRLSVSGDFQDMSISIEDVVVTVDVIRSLIPSSESDSHSTELFDNERKANGMNSDDIEIGRLNQCQSDASTFEQPNHIASKGECENEGNIGANPLLKLLSGMEINLQNIRIKLAIFDNTNDMCASTGTNTDTDEYQRATIPTVVELGIRDLVLTSEPPLDNDGIFSNFFRKKLSVGGGNIGLWLKIVSIPSDFLVPPADNLRRSRSMQQSDVYWSRSHWESLRLFQCAEINMLIQFSLDDESDDLSEQHVNGVSAYNDLGDSALFGMNVVPQSDSLLQRHSNKNARVEHICLKSNFHRVSRGLRRRVVPGSNAMADDPSSWGCTEKDKHPLDARMPVPGLVVHFSALAPIEVNICRRCVDVINTIRSVFAPLQQGRHSSDKDDDDTISFSSNEDQTSSESNKNASNNESSNRRVQFDLGDKVGDSHDHTRVYPDFMQPYNVTVVGMELSKVIVRMQIMEETSFDTDKSAYNFGFVEFSTYSVGFDLHRLSAEEMPFIDSRIEVGRFELNAYKGIERQKIFTAGFTYPSGKAPTQPVRRVNAAEKILQIVPLAISSAPQNSALHLCYFSVSAVGTASPGGCIEIKLGAFDAHVREKTFGEIKSTISIVKSAVQGKLLDEDAPLATKPPIDMTADQEAVKNDDWGYTLTTDGGTLNWLVAVFLTSNIFLMLPHCTILPPF